MHGVAMKFIMKLVASMVFWGGFWLGTNWQTFNTN